MNDSVNDNKNNNAGNDASNAANIANKKALEQHYASFLQSGKVRNKNETDFDAFRKFHEKREESYKKTRRKSEIEQIRKNVQQWDEIVHSGYKGLTLKDDNSRGAKRLVKALKSANGNESMFVYSDSPKSRETLIYALLRDYVIMGRTSFSQVLHLTENDLTLWATTGFQGQNKFDEKISDKNVNTVVVHGFSDREYTTKELRLLEQVINHCFYENYALVFSSGAQLGTMETLLTPSGAAVLRDVLGKNVVNV